MGQPDVDGQYTTVAASTCTGWMKAVAT